MQVKKLGNIISVELIDAMALQVKFDLDWRMEDSVKLSEQLITTMSAKVIERVQGADLHSVRLQVKNAELLLNFEEYSHSCWLECATEQDSPGLLVIKNILLRSMI
jgi:hypothetical protein